MIFDDTHWGVSSYDIVILSAYIFILRPSWLEDLFRTLVLAARMFLLCVAAKSSAKAEENAALTCTY